MKRSIQVAVILGFILTLGISVGVAAEPVRWNVNGHYYEFIDDRLNWNDAEVAAEARGGYLVTITSADENLWLTQTFDLYDLHRDPWIGGYQAPGSPEPAGGWSWVTGEPWNYTNWYPPWEPNDLFYKYYGGHHEDYAQFSHGVIPDNGKTWNDLYRNRLCPYVVEYDVRIYEEDELVPTDGGKVVDDISLAYIYFATGVLDQTVSVNIDALTKTITCEIGNQDFSEEPRFYGVEDWDPVQNDEQDDPINHKIIGEDGYYSATEPNVIIEPGSNFRFAYNHYCYVAPEDTIEKAELTLGIGDMDTAASGDQVDFFRLDGIAQATQKLERPVSNNKAMITSIEFDPALLADGTLRVELALKGPGLEDPISEGEPERETPSNSAGIDFARIDLTILLGPAPTAAMSGYARVSQIVDYSVSNCTLSGPGAEIGLPVSGTPYKELDPSKLRLFKYDDVTDSWSNYQVTGSIEYRSLPSGQGTVLVAKGVYDFSTFAVFMEIEQPGDLDSDSDVDQDDLNILLTYRNQPASACPECDIDGDGIITVLDARKLVLLCTRPRCACE